MEPVTLTQEERESLALLVDTPEMWAAVKRMLEAQAAYRLKRLLSHKLDKGAEHLAYEHCRYEGASWLAQSVASDIEIIARKERERG